MPDVCFNTIRDPKVTLSFRCSVCGIAIAGNVLKPSRGILEKTGPKYCPGCGKPVYKSWR